MKRFVSFLAALLLVTQLPLAALAAEFDLSVDSVSVDDTYAQYVNDENSKTEHGGSVTVTQSNSETATSNTVTVTTTTADVTVTLEDVNISAKSSAVTVNAGENTQVTIELDGENTANGGGMNGSGVRKTGEGNLTIQDESGNSGSLSATSTYSAAIGGKRTEGASNITIDSGTVNASASYGAAIGGGQNGAASDITINGGTVNAKSSFGAAIGAGQSGDASNITINNGTVNATGSFGAGIGGGQSGNAQNITINNGTVTAKAGSGSAIGAGQYSDADGIEINGGEVTATTGGGGAAIGGGLQGDAANITINDGNVTASTTYGGAAIGGGDGSTNYDSSTKVWTPVDGGDASNISINGGTVNATGSHGAAAIGGGGARNQNVNGGDGSNITISGDAVVNATSESNKNYDFVGAAIGGGGGATGGAGSDITIAENAQVTASSDGNAFGGGQEQEAVEPNTEGLYTTGSVNGNGETVNGTVPSPVNPEAPKDPEIPADTKTPEITEPAQEAPAVLAAPIFTVKGGAAVEQIEETVLYVTAQGGQVSFAVTLAQLKTLAARGIETVVFLTDEGMAAYSIAALLEALEGMENVTVTIDGETVTLHYGDQEKSELLLDEAEVEKLINAR